MSAARCAAFRPELGDDDHQIGLSRRPDGRHAQPCRMYSTGITGSMEDYSPRPSEFKLVVGIVEVGDLTLQTSVHVLARDQAAKGAFDHAAFLAEECDDNCHIPHHVAFRRFVAQEERVQGFDRCADEQGRMRSLMAA